MRIFVAGAAGAIGQRLVPLLVQAGHQVTGTTHNPAKADVVRALGAEPVVVDALDPAAVLTTVGDARPAVVVHQLSALSGRVDFRRFDQSFAQTNRLRTEGTRNLLAAARAAGARRFVAQSFTGWPNVRTGGPVKTELDPIDPQPTAASRETVTALRILESTVTQAEGIEGIVLRYGIFYGPGTAIAPGGAVLEMVRNRRLPVVGEGGGVWSFVHIDDAARATVAACEGSATGIYNIVDDDPAPVRHWLPYLAGAIGAKPPRRMPTWLVRPLLGEQGISMMTMIRGSSNAKARAELGWQPAYPSWRQGFREGLGPKPVPG